MKAPPEEIEKQIELCSGNITLVAQKMKCSRRYIYNQIQKFTYLQDVLDDAREQNLDELEHKLYSMAKAGDQTLLKFALSTQGRSRGYGNLSKVEIEAKVDMSTKREKSAYEDAVYLQEVLEEFKNLEDTKPRSDS